MDKWGHGFIQPDDGWTDVFVHTSTVEISTVESVGRRGLNEGQKVTHDLERGRQSRTSTVNLPPQ